LEAVIRQIGDENVESVAVALLHSYANPEHEIEVAKMLAASLPGVSVTISSEVCPEIKEYERTSTATANAYVQPLMSKYLGRMTERLKTEGF
jgi:N-methylhydantoinase A